MRPARFAPLGAAFVISWIASAADTASRWLLWYDRPAQSWEEALPVGNGRIGAMVFGGIAEERLQLNENTLWSGRPGDYDRVGAHRHLPEIRRLLFEEQPAAAEALVTREVLGERPLGWYQPLGELRIDLGAGAGVTDYRRELDLDSALCRTTYTQDGARFTREVFASAPDQVIVIQLTCDQPRRISLRATLSRVEAAETTSAGPDTIELRGQADRGKPTAGVQFAARVRAVAVNGTVASRGGVLSVDSADRVTVFVAAGTDHRGPEGLTRGLGFLAAADRDYSALREAHHADHRRLFRRVQLQLGAGPDDARPTNVRLKRFKAGESDPGLMALFFHYGRYLLIGSSRPGGRAANLQGLWNDRLAPPWFCGWHFDVNAQMIYWPAEVTDLAECHAPLFDLIEELRAPGRRTARDVYGSRGFVVSHRTNGWNFTSPVRGLTTWPPGAAWLCQHLWEHYRFSRDRRFLETQAYPILREAAEFFLDWLVPDPRTGKLVSGPSISPENSYLLPPDQRPYGLSMGPTMDQQIVAELFDHCLAAARELGLDDPFVREVREKRARLAGTSVGPDGRLLEWSVPRVEREPGHRHLSHLYALFPGDAISPRRTPELAEAARKSLAFRISGGGTTRSVNLSDASNVGWSLAWNANLWARLGEAGQAVAALENLLRRATQPNLFDTHPQKDTPGVFQIDGNMGSTAAIAELLLQSHHDDVHLLPALPATWTEGNLAGLRARGGYAVEIAWKRGQLERASVTASLAGRCVIRAPQAFTSEAGPSEPEGGLHRLSVDLRAGQTLVLHGRPAR